MGSTSKKLIGWQRRKERVRKKISGTPQRPRLTIFRSSKHIYAQVIDDTTGVTLAAASSNDKEFGGDDLDKKGAARKVGSLIAERCQAKQIEAVVFDRNGYLYNSGRVHALAEGARESGLKF
ncbi:MAG: 50S ribosomal protein L18 [Myxococcales bacterium]|nr:50S ribosomal protein L18 [Myxococcales bacterium]MCB9519905.1 50S ribosomal protein L18 [Myxococcales bacterium]MCB9533188.1 50S ribosomal protein L18 [Myxococcales bacterium]